VDTTQIAYEVRDHVATITLDRPDRLNAFTNEMLHEMIAAFDELDADDDVRAVVVTGRGRAFCAGADLSAGAESFSRVGRDVPTGNDVPHDGGGLLSLRIFQCLKPVIAAVNGAAVGIGVTMTLPMDFRLASEDARFGFVFTRRGVVPEACSTWFLPRLVGMQQAAEWVYSGRVFPADEALAGGLVRGVYLPDRLLPAAYALAAELMDHTAPVSVALARRMLWRGLCADHPMVAHRAESRGIHLRGMSADAREGVSSFLEKRPPDFPLQVGADLPDLFPDWVEPEYS
jgi:enoyl-CoA hydratase/carnithine racemase